jgi:hypothetical protein
MTITGARRRGPGGRAHFTDFRLDDFQGRNKPRGCRITIRRSEVSAETELEVST